MNGFWIAFLSALLCSRIANADQFTEAHLKPFTAIQSLLPYRGAVVASEDDTYSVSLYAPKEITERAEATVSDSSVLSIGLNGDKAVENQTVSVYNYTISMPSGSLSSFGTDVATSLNINGTAANTSSFTLDARAPSGSAKLMVTDLASRAVDVNTTGFGSAHLGLTSNVSRLDFNSTGSGSANITGMSGTINVNVDGLSNLAVGPSTNSLVINAFTTGTTPTRVTYFTGSCYLISVGLGGMCIKSTASPAVTTG